MKIPPNHKLRMCHVIEYIHDFCTSIRLRQRTNFMDSSSLTKPIVSYDSPPYLKKAKPIAGSASEKNTQYLSTKVVISAPALLCPLASYKLQYLAILKSRAEHLFEVINSRDDVLRTLMGRCTYLRYVETGLTDRVLYADEILKYGFCLNVIKTSLCPLEVLKNVQEAV
ncbi:hypothetical protein YC2023_114955 [Brassica napus]